MIQVRRTIAINGVEVTMLFTPRLFVMAEAKAIKISVDSGNIMHTLSAYADICYCAALNHWSMDSDIEDFPFKRADFHEWSSANQAEFSKVVALAVEAITGKTIKELVEEQKAAKEAGKEIKKKSRLSAIMQSLRRFWSGIVE